MKTILIIDDEAPFRALLTEWLQAEGWTVSEAPDGEKGIDIAKSLRPDVILCDLLMAPINGFQVCRRIRKLQSLRMTSVVVVSGRDFQADRQGALESGADEYLIKPFLPEQLRALLARMLELKAAREHETDSRRIPPSPSLTLRFWGVRGSVPTPGPGTLGYGGNTSCLELRAFGHIVIVDAGTGLRMLGKALLNEFGDRPFEMALLLTHTHWDHIQGLPFFLPVYRRHNHLRILGYEGARQGLYSVLNSQMETPFFPVLLREMPANISIEELRDLEFNVGPIQVRAMFANHPGICVGFRITASGRSVTFFPDNELPPQEAASQRPRAEALKQFARSEREKLSDFIRGSDVLIMDSQYDSEEYKAHMGWGHGCVDQVVRLAMESEIKRLFLFHHDPDHDDKKIDAMVSHARELVSQAGSKMPVDAAREGLGVDLEPVES